MPRFVEVDESFVRERCYGCYRPVGECLCGQLPLVANRTNVLLVQHRREQFHPFNTARLVRRALLNSSFVVDHKDRLAERLTIDPQAGLLYPGDDAELLDDLPRERHPRQLVVVDGTWHQTKTLVRDIAALRCLPRYRLAPSAPSEYRIRREPSAESLSTVEAVVTALRVLEPETAGFDKLLDAFRAMVNRQAEHPSSERQRRLLAKRGRTVANIPLALLERLDHIVVACGEWFADGRRGTSRREPLAVSGPMDSDIASRPRPAYWVAERMVSGERLAITIEPADDEWDATTREDAAREEVASRASLASGPRISIGDEMLGHWELDHGHFREAKTLEEARLCWSQFLCPNDRVVVFHSGTSRLMEQLSPGRGASLILKSIKLDSFHGQKTIEHVVSAERLETEPVWCAGRAGRRLAQTKALTLYLRDLARKGSRA